MSYRRKSEKRLYIEIFNAIYVANIKGLIDEIRYIRVLQTISEKGFKTYHIKNFDRLVVHLKQLKLEKSYAVSILIYLRDENYRKILNICRYFPQVKSIITIRKMRMMDKIYEINKIFRHMHAIAKSFVKRERMQSVFTEIMPGGVLTREVVQNEWFHYNRRDIVERLHNLVDLFSLDQLKFMGVRPISINSLQRLGSLDLQRYYDVTIGKMLSAIKSWKRICLLYIDVYLRYVEICQSINSGGNVDLHLKSFEIVIEDSRKS